MTHAYRLPIRVWRSKNAERGPVVLSWRSTRNRVLEIFQEWELADRWWVSPAEAWRKVPQQADRHYYRLRCQETGASFALLCEI